MDNKTQSFQFRKTKLALAVAMTVGLAACGVDGDEGSVSTSTATTDASQPTQVNVSMPKGSIQGVVLDTNGHPVVGATVTVAGQTATTDSSGSYLFNDVQVTNVAGADAPTGHAAFVVVVQAPEGYASTATVNVTPNAQVDATNGNNNSGDAAGDSVGAPLTTFIDGFLAQAGTAIMPKKGSVIEGWIRSDITGEATAGAEVSLDFTGLSGTVVAGGANVALAGDFAKTMTDANGYYRFEGVYDDSVYNLSIEDYTFAATSTTTTSTTASVAAVESYTVGAAAVSSITTDNTVASIDEIRVNGADVTANFTIVNGAIVSTDGTTSVPANAFVIVKYDYNVTTTSSTTTTAGGGQTSGSTPATTAEGVDINMGTLTVRPITSADTISPYVSDVTGWIKSSTGGYGILNEGVNKTITIHFSEPVNTDTFNVAELLVTDSSSNILATEAENGVVLAADGRSVTIDLAEAQDPGTKISVFIPWQDATDVAGNFFSTTANDNMDIDFDNQQNATSGKASFLRVNLCVFLPAVINPTGYAAAQFFDRVEGTDAGSTELASYSNAFLDNESSTGDVDVRQLNGDDTVTAAQLDALGTLISGGAITVDSDHAGVTVTRGQASGYTFTGNTGGTSTAARQYFDGVEHGDSVTFTFFNDLSLAAGSVAVTLVDGVKPTAILQENYELYNEAGYTTRVVTTGAVPNLGAGGEVTEVGVEATNGNPIIYVQPRHITPVNTTTNVAIRGNEWNDLTQEMQSRLEAGETGNLSTKADGATANPLYDDAAWDQWTPRTNSLGFAFSEDVSLTADANIIFSGVNSALLGTYSAVNNVTNNIDNTANAVGPQDLIRGVVTDYLALANENHNTTVSFAGDVQDAFGNVADGDSRAVVQLRDAFPPMVTDATWEGTSVLITFNEAVAPVTGSQIVIDDLDITPDAAAYTVTLNSALAAPSEGAFVLSGDGTQLRVYVTGTTVNGLMETGDSGEFEYEQDGELSEKEKHASLNWDNIPDARGNVWATFDNDTDVALARHEVNAPRFMMYDNVGTFTVGYSFFNLTGPTDDNFNISITFTHPIDVTDGNAFDVAADGDNDGTYFEDGATDINAVFLVDIDGVLATAGDNIGFPAGTTAALSGDRQRIDIVMPNATVLGTAATLGTSILRGIPTVDSAITGQTRTMTEVINN